MTEKVSDQQGSQRAEGCFSSRYDAIMDMEGFCVTLLYSFVTYT